MSADLRSAEELLASEGRAGGAGSMFGAAALGAAALGAAAGTGAPTGVATSSLSGSRMKERIKVTTINDRPQTAIAPIVTRRTKREVDFEDDGDDSLATFGFDGSGILASEVSAKACST